MKKSNLKPATHWDDFAEALKSAAHPKRLAILHLMSNCGREKIMVKSIYETLHLKQSITSRHLGIMKKTGLLKREINEGKTFYRINPNNLTIQCIRKLLME